MQISSLRLALISLVASVFFGPAHAQTLKRVEQADFGKSQDGSDVKLITLRNSKGMNAQIISYGAIIKELQAPDRDGKVTNILLTTDSLDKFEKGFGGAAAVIGRVANRIAGAQFELDGATYKLNANERKNTIHGGRKGFAQSVWTVEEAPMKPNESSVKLTYVSKDGEEGFPGILKTSVTYSLTDNNELRIDYQAETDKPTIVNLTNHAYWNLAGSGSCLDNILSIPAEKYTPTDAELIPTGEVLPLRGTPMDFSQPTRIGERMEQLKPKLNGYDHNYVLGEGNAVKMAARLEDPKSGRVMEVRTTQPAVQLYTANHLAHTAVCLETQHYPDAIHHQNFPSIVVRPGEPLKETTLFTFTTAGPSLLADGAKVEALGEGYSFTEGPAVDREGNVFFTDQPNDRIVKYSAADGSFSDWLKPAGRSNGTYFDKAGNLLACADEKNELWSISPEKKVTVLISDFGGKLLNGPNDLWIRPDGKLYFTDPLYARDYWKRDKAMQQPGQYVYFFDVKSKKATPAATDLKQPNGIIGTPDGKTLYVADIGASKTYSYTVNSDGSLANKALFCELGSDGMTIDAEGNVYLTGKGVTVFDKTGKKLTNIPIPEPWTANVTFGGADRKLLFITASKKVYGVKMRVKGAY
jgi:gluconolactonase